MTYRFLPNGSVETDTVEELIAYLDAIKDAQTALVAKPPEPPVRSRTEPLPGRRVAWSPSCMRELMEKMEGENYHVLIELVMVIRYIVGTAETAEPIPVSSIAELLDASVQSIQHRARRLHTVAYCLVRSDHVAMMDGGSVWLHGESLAINPAFLAAICAADMAKYERHCKPTTLELLHPTPAAVEAL